MTGPGRCLLLVDGTNVVMRCAFGGDVPPERAVPTAAGLIERAARELLAGWLIVAFDSAGPSWRRTLFPAYKAHRTAETWRWSDALREELEQRGVFCVQADGFEADDCLATLAGRVVGIDVVILSGDSDLLTCCRDTVRVAQPASGGAFRELREADVCAKYGIPTAASLTDYKALVGEPGDNLPGVPGIGPKKASRLLMQHRTLAAVMIAGGMEYDRETARVAEHGDAARQALQLARLRTDVPLPPVKTTTCMVPQSAAGASA